MSPHQVLVQDEGFYLELKPNAEHLCLLHTGVLIDTSPWRNAHTCDTGGLMKKSYEIVWFDGIVYQQVVIFLQFCERV